MAKIGANYAANMLSKGTYELAAGLKPLPDSIPLAPEYQGAQMDTEHSTFLEQQQAAIAMPEPSQQMEIEP